MSPRGLSEEKRVYHLFITMHRSRVSECVGTVVANRQRVQISLRMRLLCFCDHIPYGVCNSFRLLPMHHMS